jgi:hypothetical protein
MSKSLLSCFVILLSSIVSAQELVDQSPLVQLGANDKLVARSVRVKSLKSDAPYTVNPIPNVSPSEYDKFRWCQVEGVTQNQLGVEESITLFLPMIVNTRFSYPLDERLYRPVQIGRTDPSYRPPFEPRFGMQLFYPKSSDIVEGSQLLVISEASNRVIPMASLLLASRATFNTREPMVLFPHMIESLKFQSDWQARQVAYWILSYPSSNLIRWQRDHASFRGGNELHRRIAQLLIQATNHYRKAKVCEIGYHLFTSDRLSRKKGEASIPDDFGLQYFIHKINAIGLADSYYDLGLDPSIRILFRSYAANAPDHPETTLARSIKLLDQGVMPIELQQFLIAQFDNMSELRKYTVGAKLMSFEDQSGLASRIQELVFPYQKSNLSANQQAVYEEMKKESFERGREFLQEFCRWKLGRPTAEWFPRE